MGDDGKGITPPEGSEAGETASTRTGGLAAEPFGLIGPYRLLQKIGEGGMGEVWLAEQAEPVRRRVALKVIKQGMDTKQVIARFEAERQALAMMDHPYIAKVFEAGSTAEGRPYFAMEHVPGVPITEHCDRQRLDTKERLKLFMQLCEGVQHAHQKAIIHRDLKPSNVLVSVRDGRVVPTIIDFGVAKATAQRLTELTMFTQLGALIGTLDYMSPEQADLTNQDVDTRTDVYSLGVMLYELLVGVLPFEPKELRSGGLDSFRRKILEQEPPKPSTRLITLGGERSTATAKRRHVDLPTLRRELSGDLDWITMKALEKDRTRRYGSAAELSTDIERHILDEPVLARPPSTAYRAGKFVRRHRMGVAFAASGVLVLIAFAVTMMIQAAHIARERDRATREAERATRESETARHVSDFLLGLFQVSDPGEAQGNTVTAREILDRGAAQITGGLKDQPLVQARLMETMGKVYRNLGLVDKAAPLLKEALKIRESILGPEHPDVARSLYELAMVGKEGSLALHRRALAIREKTLGPEHPDVAYSLWAIGFALTFGGDLQGGQRSLERALRIFEKDPESNSIGMSWCLNDLGVVHFLQGDYEAARPLFERALKIKETKLGPNHWDTANGMNSLGSTLTLLGDYDAAKPLLERSLAIYERVFGPGHPSTGGTLHSLGELLHLMHRDAEAKPVLERAVAIFERPGQGDRLARPLGSLALVLLELGETERAEACYQRALALRRNVQAEAFQLDRNLEAYAARKKTRRANGATVPGP